MPAPHHFGGPFGQLDPISLSWALPALILKKTRLTSEDRHMLGARRPWAARACEVDQVS